MRAPRWRRSGGELGSSSVEFVLLVVVIFVPLTYGVLAFSAVQRTVMAATDAARQAGRAIATSSEGPALARAEYAARLAAESQDLDPATVQVWTAPVSSSCDSSSDRAVPSLAPGEVFVVCVRLPIRLPLMPELLSSSSATGKYVVAMDAFR